MTPLDKLRAALQAIVNSYETAGCDGCGTVSQDVIDNAEKVLKETLEK